MCVNNLPKVATQWNSGVTRDSNRGRRVLIPSALTTTPPSEVVAHVKHYSTEEVKAVEIWRNYSLSQPTIGAWGSAVSSPSAGRNSCA